MTAQHVFLDTEFLPIYGGPTLIQPGRFAPLLGCARWAGCSAEDANGDERFNGFVRRLQGGRGAVLVEVWAMSRS